MNLNDTESRLELASPRGGINPYVAAFPAGQFKKPPIEPPTGGIQ